MVAIDDDNDDGDDDDDDCQFVERPNIHGKAIPVAHTGVVFLPDDRQIKHRQKKKTKM